MSEIQIEQIRDDLTWRIRHEAMYPDLPLEAVKLEDDSEGTHFGLYAGDQLSTVVSIFSEGTTYRFRKFATAVDAQGKGYGTALLKHIIEYVTFMGAKMLWCNARVSAAGFYERFGFVKTNKISRNYNIDFVIMELQLDN
ncbi:GNAT family N-acetyltransferase [Pedobacter frigoris]|uniref:GNAT family N-acetyltransferase n=1 Tax=Pedobacter frigoris TaxID=2571272 RepID=A0A4U1CLP5_9SPHI|nr:GNAT family N-acetyltransferase [Pedobacter frigoris]TKC07241.1 GNAT family N-acetyltransferase [Pedobacter frigoris]